MATLILQPPPAMPRPRQVLLLAYYFFPESASGAQRPHRFKKYLSEMGYSVDTVSRHLADTEPAEGVARVPRADAGGGWVKWAGAVSGFLQRYCLPYNEQLPWVPHAVAAGRRILARRTSAVLISSFPPLATHLAAFALQREFGVPWVADFRDPLSDNPFRSRRIGDPYDRWLEHWVLHSADAVICNTDAMAALWRRRYPHLGHKISLIWNGYDPEEVFAAPARTPRDFRLLVHMGSLYGGRRPDLLVESLARLLSSGQIEAGRLRLQLVGPIDNGGPAANSDARQILSNAGCLEVRPQVPRPQAKQLMGEADYLVLFDLNSSNTAVQVPAKLFDYIQVGRPVLAFTPEGSPSERILLRSGIPSVCVTPAAPAAVIDRKILTFLRLAPEAVEASPWFFDNFNARTQAAQLAQILDQVCGERSATPCAPATRC